MISKVVVVGGGTAGWLAVNHLAHSLKGQPVQITLLESPTIPTIGVGEGTVPAIRQSLKKMGISEADFIRECDVTFKQSIKFINWLDRAQHGENAYHHLFDVPVPFGLDLTADWLQQPQQPFAAHVAKQYAVVQANKAPKLISTPEYQGLTSYAYHLDAKKFAAFMQRHAIEKAGVCYRQADVLDVELDAAGYIVALNTAQHGRVEADFVVDCTGFSSLILGQKLGVPFIDRSDWLLTDTALAVQVPFAQDIEIPSFTLATAHQAGWIWDIHLNSRRGVGLVYSSAHLSEDAATAKLDKYLGGNLAQHSFRKIPMKVGRRQHFWQRNCVAIGLSQGFVEPLEATAILVADFSADLLSKRFPKDRAENELLAARFNQRVVHCWDQILEFIKLHYCASDRSDSQFWRDNRDPATIPPQLRDKLQLWRSFPPCREDFFSKFEIFDFENFLYVLYGMKYPTQTPICAAEYLAIAAKHRQQVAQQALMLTEQLPGHRALLEKIRQYGLQKI